MQSEGLGPAQPARVPSPARCADPVAPNFLKLHLLDSLNGDVKGKSSWVLCWEQPVLGALLSPLVPVLELQVAWLGIVVLGQFRWWEDGRGPLPTACLPVHRGGVWEEWCLRSGGVIDCFQHSIQPCELGYSQQGEVWPEGCCGKEG